MTTTISINTSVSDIVADLDAAKAGIADVLRTGTYTDRDLLHLVATFSGVGEDIDVVIGDLDPLDVETLLLMDTGLDTVVLWRWQLAVRHGLGMLAARSRDAQAAAESLVSGVDARTHVVRSGETLQAIALRYLGDWREWTRIATLNDLAPGQPASGTVLTIPPRR